MSAPIASLDAEVGTWLRTKPHTVSNTFNVGEAFRVLLEHRITAAPVVDTDENGLGVVSQFDIVKFVVDRLRSAEASSASVDELLLTTKATEIMASGPDVFMPASTTFRAALGMMSQFRRLGVTADNSRQVVGLVTQKQLFRAILPLVVKAQAFNESQVGQTFSLGGVLSVGEETPAIDAFELMVKHQAHSVAIVNEDGALVTNVSLSDIRAVAYSRSVNVLLDTAMNVVSLVRQHDVRTTVSPSISCHADTVVKSLVSKLAATQVHRIFVVDADHKPIGSVGLNDVCMAYLKFASSQPSS